jgi:hypothetical protein
MTNTAKHLPAQWEARPYGTHWGFAYNVENKTREEYDFTIEFHESISEPEQLTVLTLIEAAPILLGALKYADIQLSEFKADTLKKMGLDVALTEIQDALALATDNASPAMETATAPAMTTIDRILTDIARQHLDILTLDTRRSDSLDFHNVAVWSVADALKAAFDAGANTSRVAYTTPTSTDTGLPIRFDDYEIHGVREYHGAPFGQGKYNEQVPDDDAQFWSLFGHIPGQGLDCIGDFKTRQHAEEIYAHITGRQYGSRL